MKTYVKRYSHTTSPGIRNEFHISITGEILDSPPTAHSAPLQATTMLFSFINQFEGSPSWAYLILMPLPRHFWLPCAPFCCCCKPVAPPFLNHASNQEDLGYPVLSQHSSWWEFPWSHIQPRERRDGPWAEVVRKYTPGHSIAQIYKDIVQRLACFYSPFSTEGKILALYTLNTNA